MLGERYRKVSDFARFPASPSSHPHIGTVINNAVGRPIPQASRTAVHENKHRKAFGGNGEYAVHVEAVIDLTSGQVMARWVASFIPDLSGEDTESPEFFERMIRTAEAVGSEMSGQDKRVRDRFTQKLSDWLSENSRRSDDEQLNGEDNEAEDEDSEETPYEEILRKFRENIDKLAEEGNFPDRDGLIEMTGAEVVCKNKEVLKDAWRRACKSARISPFRNLEGEEMKPGDSEGRKQLNLNFGRISSYDNLPLAV